jgi:hypothetical protein
MPFEFMIGRGFATPNDALLDVRRHALNARTYWREGRPIWAAQEVGRAIHHHFAGPRMS